MNTTQETHAMNATAAQPWWKTPQMWLVLGLPAAVIVGGSMTMWIAVARPDAVVDPDYYAKGLALGQRAQAVDKGQVPAQMGRNHAMTPDKDVPALKLKD